MKWKKILIINILIIAVLFLLSAGGLELYFFLKRYEIKNPKDIIDSIHYYLEQAINPINADDYFSSLYKNEEVIWSINPLFPPSVGYLPEIHKNKSPLLFMGCSFTRGRELNDNETVAVQASKLANRPAYNRAGEGWGLSQFLYQTRRNDFYESIPQEPEFLIYTYIDDHRNRIGRFRIYPSMIDNQPLFKVKDNQLIEVKPKFYESFLFVQQFRFSKLHQLMPVNDEVVALYFKSAEEEIHTRWKNTKMVILYYPVVEGDKISKDLYEKLLKLNYYMVIDVSELTDKPIGSKIYQTFSGHPAAEAWKIILPKLFDRLGIEYTKKES